LRDFRAMTRRKTPFRGNGVSDLRQGLLRLCATGSWPLLEPLPVTRFLGESYGISNVSAHRVLTALSGSNKLWRAANGRFFMPEAKRLLEKPAPVACLFRRLERWTEVGREIMQGVDQGCGKLERAILLVHDRVLFRQTDPMGPVSLGQEQELQGALEDFLTVYSERIGGVILDELWPDHVLAKFQRRLRSGVVVYRRSSISKLGCVSADAGAAARLVIGHAKKNGFERLAILKGVRGYLPSEEMASSLRKSAAGQFPPPQVFEMHTLTAMGKLLASLRKERRRMLVVGTEDNVTVAALESIRNSGFDMPGKVGLVSTMGTRIASERSITIFGFDFRRIGEEAATMAVGGQAKHIAIPPVVVPGCTA